MKLDGIGIFVSDMKTMVEFYKNILGFELEWDGKEPNVMLKKDGVLFMFYGRNDFEKMTNRQYNYANGINGNGANNRNLWAKDMLYCRSRGKSY